MRCNALPLSLPLPLLSRWPAAGEVAPTSMQEGLIGGGGEKLIRCIILPCEWYLSASSPWPASGPATSRSLRPRDGKYPSPRVGVGLAVAIFSNLNAVSEL
jgi:hypothetical protein